VTERGKSWVGEVARPDELREDEVGQALEERDDEEVHHRGAVHREELVVGLGVEERVLGDRELEPHEQGHDARNAEERQRGDHVACAQVGVVHGREPTREPTGYAPGRLEAVDPPAQLGRVYRHASPPATWDGSAASGNALTRASPGKRAGPEAPGRIGTWAACGCRAWSSAS